MSHATPCSPGGDGGSSSGEGKKDGVKSLAGGGRKGVALDKLLLFGDSITQDSFKQDHGYCVGAGLHEHYVRKLEVVSRGFSGYNSDHGAVMIKKIIETETTAYSKIALMVVFFGTNDSVIPPHIQHVPVPRFQENLRAIARVAEGAGIPVVMVGPAPFVWHSWVAMRPGTEHERSTDRQREYCDAVIDVGREFGLPVIALWYSIMAEVGWTGGWGKTFYGAQTDDQEGGPLKEYFWDGLHFAGPAYHVLFNRIVVAIEKHYPHLDAEKMEQQMPAYDQIPSLDFLKLQM